MRELKRHGHIIALSQSELMLVVALIFLLLFYMVASSATQNGEKPPLTPELEKEIAENQPPKNLDEELLQELILALESTGFIDEQPKLSKKQEKNDLRALVEQTVEQLKELDAEVKQLLIESESEPRKNKSEALREIEKKLGDYKQEAEIAKKRLSENNNLEAEVDQLLKDNGRPTHGNKSESLKEFRKWFTEFKQIAEITENLVYETSGKNSVSLRGTKFEGVNFIPCWLGDGLRKKYYFTFRLTYSNTTKKYTISPHPDQKSDNETVLTDVRHRLPALKEYPKGQVDKEVMEKYTRKLNTQKEKVHGEECRLAATLNDEVNGKIIKYIRDEFKLYPII